MCISPIPAIFREKENICILEKRMVSYTIISYFSVFNLEFEILLKIWLLCSMKGL